MNIDKLRTEAESAYDKVIGEYGAVRRFVVAHPGLVAGALMVETVAVAGYVAWRSTAALIGLVL